MEKSRKEINPASTNETGPEIDISDEIPLTGDKAEAESSSEVKDKNPPPTTETDPGDDDEIYNNASEQNGSEVLYRRMDRQVGKRLEFSKDRFALKKSHKKNEKKEDNEHAMKESGSHDVGRGACDHPEAVPGRQEKHQPIAEHSIAGRNGEKNEKNPMEELYDIHGSDVGPQPETISRQREEHQQIVPEERRNRFGEETERREAPGSAALQDSQMGKSTFYCKVGTRMDELRTKASEVGDRNKCDVLCTPSSVMTNQASVKVLFDEIQSVKVDAIVNSSNKMLILKVSPGLSTAILMAAGQCIQEELRRNRPEEGLEYGNVVKSASGNISSCKAIYHAVLPIFFKNKREKECYEALVKVVLNTLLMASSEGFTSVAFPALGTGNLGYPVEKVVQLMFMAVFQFFDCAASPIQKVFFVIHPKADPFLKQLFLMEEFSHQFHTVKVDKLSTAHRELTKDPAPMCETRFKIGKTFLQISNGDIRNLCDVVDVIFILWRGDYLNSTWRLHITDDYKGKEENPVVSCFDRSVQNTIYSNYVPNLYKGCDKVEEDTTSFKHTRLIHLYCKDDTEEVIARAIARGLKHMEHDVTAVTMSIHSDGSRLWQPHIIANILMKALEKDTSMQHVVQVILQDNCLLEPFLTFLLDYKSVNVDPSIGHVFDTLFTLSKDGGSIGDVMITVTPRSREATDGGTKVSADNVVLELKRELGITLMVKTDSVKKEQ